MAQLSGDLAVWHTELALSCSARDRDKKAQLEIRMLIAYNVYQTFNVTLREGIKKAKKQKKPNSNDKVLAKGNKSQHICQKLQQRDNANRKIKMVTLTLTFGDPLSCDL